jgi:UDP-2,3-diacylglucosamine hydrolase
MKPAKAEGRNSPQMTEPPPRELALIAGKGVYPLLLANAAKRQGVAKLFVVAFRRETERAVEEDADHVEWIYLGQFGAMLEALRRSGVRHAVMAGQITPTHLFNIRPDRKMLELLQRLRVRNAETIFGAVAEELKTLDITLLPASSFMEEHMPPAGLLSHRAPTESESRDIEMGFRVAKVTSGLDIGQTVVIKDGTILAVEAFEGTDETILRAGKLGGPGIVIVKVAKQGHDMRFDIPVVGLRTMKVLRSVKASTLAVEARRAILLERKEVLSEADRLGICVVSVETPNTAPSGAPLQWDKAGPVTDSAPP